MYILYIFQPLCAVYRYIPVTPKFVCFFNCVKEGFFCLTCKYFWPYLEVFLAHKCARRVIEFFFHVRYIGMVTYSVKTF
jgi:hypothetical protein